SIAPAWQPFTTHLNMGMTNTVNRTNDCIAYINKLAGIGTNLSYHSPLISARAAGYGNTNYVIDDVGNIYCGGNTVANATNGLISAGCSSSAIHYLSGCESEGNL